MSKITVDDIAVVQCEVKYKLHPLSKPTHQHHLSQSQGMTNALKVTLISGQTASTDEPHLLCDVQISYVGFQILKNFPLVNQEGS